MLRRLSNWTIGLALLLTSAPLLAQTQAPDADTQAGLIRLPHSATLVQDGDLLLSDSFLRSQLGYSITTEGTRTSVKIFGHAWVLRDGASICTVDGVERPVSAPVRRVGDSIYLPAETLLQPIGARLRQVEGGLFAIEPPRVQVRDVRQGTHPDRVRLVIDLVQPAPFSWEVRGGAVVLRIPTVADEEGRESLLRQLSFPETLLPTVTESRSNGWSELTVVHSSPHPPEVFTLSEPSRIVLDVLRPEPIAPSPSPQSPSAGRPPGQQKPTGIAWRSYSFDTSRGPVRGWLLTVDPTDPQIVVRPAMADGVMAARRTVHAIARREGAYAAVNGGFFAPRGQPLGLLVVDGEWIAGPWLQRAVFGLTDGGKPEIRNVRLDAWVEFEGLGRLPIEGINCDHGNGDGVSVYTPLRGSTVAGNPRRTRLVVKSGSIQAVLGAGEAAPIPPDGFVLSGAGQRAQSLLRTQVGQQVTLLMDTEPSWPGLRHAIGGGPRLLQKGKLALQDYDERFRADVTSSIRPRTAIGITAAGKLLFLVVDSVGRGMSLREVADVLRKLGAVEAMNLDGGGSSTFWVDGQCRNQPSDGSARTVSNAIIVIDRKSSAAAAP